MYYIGVDLGGTNIAAGIVDKDWNIICKDSVKTNVNDTNLMVKDMADLCLKLLADNSIPVSDIKSVGIGIPGALNTKTEEIVFSNNLNIENYPIVKEFKKYIDLPVFISNDANVAALGEIVAGAAKGYENVVVVTLGTGVGGGIILNGKIWEGFKSIGAEIGHMVIEVNGEDCTCGRKGCWEAYSSATALIRDTKRAIEKNPGSLLAKMAEKEGKVTGKLPFDAAQNGDSVAVMVIDNYIKYLAEGIANIYNLLSPEVVLLGGGVAYQGETLLVPLRKEIEKRIYAGDYIKRGEVFCAKLGNDAGIIGAAALGR